MKKRSGPIRKFFSFHRWQRRFGARSLPVHAAALDYAAMKTRIIDLGDPVLTRGSAKDVKVHYQALMQEFSGQPELAFHHAFLNALIRREFELDKTFAQFQDLWVQEADWLLANLNIRWLVSASDTFADHSPDPQVRSLALATTLLANTVKAYETENLLSNREHIVYDPERVAQVQREAIPIFEGMSCYTVGTDDTLRNMVWRMKDIAPHHISGRILMEVFNRLGTLPTAFGRMRAMHTRKKTEWWD